MEEAHKLECATCRHAPRNPNIYRGFYPLPDRPHWSHNEIFDIGPEPAMTSPDVPRAESFRESNVWPSVEPVVDWRGRMLAMLDFQRALALNADGVHRPRLWASKRKRSLRRRADETLRCGCCTTLRHRRISLCVATTATGPKGSGTAAASLPQATSTPACCRSCGRTKRADCRCAVLTGGGGKCLRRPTGSRCTVGISSRRSPAVASKARSTAPPATVGIGARSASSWSPTSRRRSSRRPAVLPVSYAQHLVNEFPERFEAPRAA